ncbi:hypothetical protein LAJ19_20235 (plasmid) [Deinococcus taeanensis]|uniref:hypothetical protein n=1 Tax=Deinococcus taeanensis TaxID=2737050 RepID=UPI001CDC63CD|nr:hypothetical protein [Deinococcus taeanensis]UBV45457.1 hypothetical protein LAJ19_20235 [Deinococcus taeanensis]
MRSSAITALKTLRLPLVGQGWPATLHALGKPAHTLRIPAEVDDAWPLLVTLARVIHGGHLRTDPVGEHRWATVNGGSTLYAPGLHLPAGRFYTEDEAALATGTDAAVLRAAWPATTLTRTVSGYYCGDQADWVSRDWLTALCGLLLSDEPFQEDELMAAFRALPDAPAVQDNTLRGVLRTHPALRRGPGKGTWRYTPEADGGVAAR